MLQSIVLRLNRSPLSPVFNRIYDFAARRAIAALSSHAAVACILGTGSYFEKHPTYGLSDVDLIVVIKDGFSRIDGAVGDLAYSYERVRRVFPFLGRWDEKEANLIFLSELAAGFPVPEAFRVRLKRGRLVELYGQLPPDLATGDVTASELLTEINTLIRFSLITRPTHARRLVFWKRIFNKLNGLAEMLELQDLAREMRARPELGFLAQEDIPLYYSKAEPDRMFALLLALCRNIFEMIADRETKVTIRPTLRAPQSPLDEPATNPAPTTSLSSRPAAQWFSIRKIPSVPIGLAPGLPYFPVDESMPLFEIHGAAYAGLQHLQFDEPPPFGSENTLVSADGFLFIAARRPKFFDIIPLDPMQFANVYAAAFRDSLQFELPANILAEQQSTAAAMFRGFAHMYRGEAGIVTRLSHPYIYREHDAEVIGNALRIIRAYAMRAPEWVLIQTSRDLFDYLSQRHPECEHFLSELECYWRCLQGDWSLGQPTANNLYRCLHQFVAQLLAGATTINLDPCQKHLGITVGVITRNRARDLAEMLESLTHQVRAPDEVLVVDNGSTDQTRAVLERFRNRLPLSYHFLERADIPGARNLVIEKSQHEIISFLDDDCISEPEWLGAVEAGFLRADNIGVVGGWVTHQPAQRRSTVDNYYRLFHHAKT